MRPDFYMNTRQYLLEGMIFEFLSTRPQQLRIVPVEKSLRPDHKISTYDEIREVIKKHKRQNKRC